MNNLPDGVLGAVFAAEGLGGVKAMINGPGGCRSRMMIALRELVPYYEGDEQGCCRSKFFSRQSNLPCTYLNANDMVVGSGPKIEAAVDSVLGIVDDDILLLDTLGASLQVTDNEGICRGKDRVIHPSRLLSSMSFGCGFDYTMKSLVSRIAEDGETVPGRVNVIGYSIADVGWYYGRDAIEDMLMSAGASEVRFIGCKCERSDVVEAGTAELNILIHPEYGRETAEFLSQRFGTRTLVPSMGSPVGYDSMCSFVTEAASELGGDPGAELDAIEREKAKVNRILTNNDRPVNGLRGTGASFRGIASDVLPLAVWLYRHLSLVPESIVITEPEETVHTAALKEFLAGIGCSEAYGNGDDSLCRVRMTDGMTAAYGMGRDSLAAYVPISTPYAQDSQLLDTSIVGPHGCRFVLDRMINGLGSFSCGQPTMADMRWTSKD